MDKTSIKILIVIAVAVIAVFISFFFWAKPIASLF